MYNNIVLVTRWCEIFIDYDDTTSVGEDAIVSEQKPDQESMIYRVEKINEQRSPVVQFAETEARAPQGQQYDDDYGTSVDVVDPGRAEGKRMHGRNTNTEINC